MPPDPAQQLPPRDDSKLPDWLNIKLTLVVLIGLIALSFLVSGIRSRYEEKPVPEIQPPASPSYAGQSTYSPEPPLNNYTRLNQAKSYMVNPMSDYDVAEAESRLKAIPKGAPEYQEAQELLKRARRKEGFPAATAPTAATPEPETDNALARSDLYIEDIKSAPVEYQLAFLDAGEPVRGTDIHATRIRYLLGLISQKTGDGKDHIADQTHRCTVVLKQNYGKAVTNLQFLEEMNNYFLAGGPKGKYDELSLMLVMTLGK
jgi:hypothetical protein